MGISVLACTLVLTAGCGSSFESPSGNSGSSSGVSLTAFADQYCSLIEPCCADAGVSTSGFICHALLQQGPRDAMFNEVVAGPCLDALRQAQSSPDFCVTLGGIPPPCLRLFGEGVPGGKPPGQACRSDEDCAPAPGGEASCGDFENLDGGPTSVCLQTLTGMAGSAPCVGDTTGAIATGFSFSQPGNFSPPTGPTYLCDLSQGVRCNPLTRICTGPADAGSPCGANGCSSTTYCDYNLICTPRLAIGAACSNSIIPCDLAGQCDQASQTCAPLLGGGAACVGDQDCLSHFCHKGSCAASTYDSNVVTICGL
jgi:hypothetical protein